MTSAAYTVDPQVKSDGEFNFLSNALFGFSLALIVPDILEGFRSDIRHWRKTRNFTFLPLEAIILTLAKK